ncbi:MULTISPECIES: GNAT family N-acetyltransferase [unclassified Enterococcus]|uniref:GNAT family N-acetyltransferase n=1 Tax=unclassified Enterococcus TaxID=2608891 RepID=UPI001A9B8410|nr:GNAT family N-acetyltransferase [Enterococcus sp. DIV1271a]MBO1299340.1 GNAT family N-acetyltransferase [Enterococcus sp. DIV1271a]
MIDYKTNARINKNGLENLYSSVGWTEYTNDLERLEKAINHSLSVITSWHQGKLVGLIRVVGDGQTILYIQDLLVHPDFQNKKIGTQLMDKVLQEYKDVRQKILLTEDASNVRRFYEKFGFDSCDKGNLVSFYKEFQLIKIRE